MKAEAKARELNQKINLTAEEKERLQTIESDVVYFKEKYDKALETAQKPKLNQQEKDEQIKIIRQEATQAANENLPQLNKTAKKEKNWFGGIKFNIDDVPLRQVKTPGDKKLEI